MKKLNRQIVASFSEDWRIWMSIAGVLFIGGLEVYWIHGILLILCLIAGLCLAIDQF